MKEIRFIPADCPELFPRAAILEWLVEEGDQIEAGTILCRYEIDKAIAEFPSPLAGTVGRIIAPPGTRLARGDLLIQLAGADEYLPEPAQVVDRVNGDFDWSEIDIRNGPPEPLSIMRKAIAERMAMSKRHIPCFYLTVTIDMSSCIARRQSMRKEGRKATFNDMMVKAAALTLAKHPRVAAVYTPEGVVPRGEYNIGFAAALPDEGLVVPVIKHADQKNLAEIALETRTLAAKAKEGKLTPNDCSGAVFAVSYLGSYEVDNFVAIVNPGEAGIIAVGKTQETPVAVDGRVEIIPQAKVTMSADHRSIDGALAARYMTDFKYLVEHAAEL